jgi:hypothetical protein
MKPNVKNSLITLGLLAALGGGLFYSTLDRKTEVATRTAIADESRRAAQMVELSGLIALDVEPFFKDERVIKLLAENNFRANVVRVGSREMAGKVVKDTAPDFFMPSGVVAGNQISEAAKKLGYTTANYSPYYTPMVIASWVPIAKILAANKMATPVGEGGARDNIYDVDLTKLTDAMLAKKRWRDFAQSQSYDVGRSVLISTTDVRKSNSAAMYLALTSYAINGSEVISNKEAARKVALQVADLYKRQGYQESYVNGNFDDYVGIGMGKTPLAFIYENQLVSYAIGRKSVDKEMVLMYPKPTIFNKVMVVTMRDKAKPFAELLSNNVQLQAIATEYGFRTNNASALPEAATKAGLVIKPRIVDVIDPPSYEIMAEMIDVITQEMKN